MKTPHSIVRRTIEALDALHSPLSTSVERGRAHRALEALRRERAEAEAKRDMICW